MSWVLTKGGKYLQRPFVRGEGGPQYGPASTAFEFANSRVAIMHARAGERAVSKPGQVAITARTNPSRNEHTMVLVRGTTPIAAYETETTSWDWPTAAGLFTDAGVKVHAKDRIGFLKGRWTRKGRPIDGGWTFTPFAKQGVDVVTVPYATRGARTNPRRRGATRNTPKGAKGSVIGEAQRRGTERGKHAARALLSEGVPSESEDVEAPSWLSGEWAGESISELLGDLIKRAPRSEDEICAAYEEAADDEFWTIIHQAIEKGY